MKTKRVEMIAYGATGDKHAPHNLMECISEFQRVLESVPEEYRDTAEVCFEPAWEFGEAYSNVQIDYQRPMTPDEVAEENEVERQHWMEQLKNANERIALCKRELAKVCTTAEAA